MQVLGEDKGQRIIAVEHLKPGGYSGRLTGGQPVPAIEDLALEQHDGFQQAMGADVGGERIERLLGPTWEDLSKRMGGMAGAPDYGPGNRPGRVRLSVTG